MNLRVAHATLALRRAWGSKRQAKNEKDRLFSFPGGLPCLSSRGAGKATVSATFFDGARGGEALSAFEKENGPEAQ